MGKTILDSIFDRLKRHREQAKRANVADIRQLVCLIGDAELGDASVDVDLETFANVVDAERMTEADLRRNIEIYKSRKQQSRLVAQMPALQQAATDAEKPFRAEVAAAGVRQREARKRIEELEWAMRRAGDAANATVIAESDLHAGGVIADEERALNVALTEIGRQIAEHELALDPNHRSGDRPTAGYLWGSVHQSPGRLAAQMRRELANSVQHNRFRILPERKTEFERTLKAAEAAVAERKAAIRALEQQRDGLNAKLVKRNADKLKPESFVIKRATLSDDERMKQEALRINFYGGPTVTVGAPK